MTIKGQNYSRTMLSQHLKMLHCRLGYFNRAAQEVVSLTRGPNGIYGRLATQVISYVRNEAPGYDLTSTNPGSSKLLVCQVLSFRFAWLRAHHIKDDTTSHDPRSSFANSAHWLTTYRQAMTISASTRRPGRLSARSSTVDGTYCQRRSSFRNRGENSSARNTERRSFFSKP